MNFSSIAQPSGKERFLFQALNDVSVPFDTAQGWRRLALLLVRQASWRASFRPVLAAPAGAGTPLPPELDSGFC